MHKKVISIAIGGIDGAYYHDALEYKKELQKKGVTLNIVPTKGSIDAQERLLNGEVDFAFVQGGTEYNDILALASVEYEPIWIFYKDDNISGFHDLQGKKIAIGEVGSGILPMSLELLQLVGIHGFNSEFYFLPNATAYKKLKDNEIDVMFYIASAHGSMVSQLMNIPNIKLMSFNEAEAYRQFFIKKEKFFKIVQLEANGFDLERRVPKKEHKLLATTAILATSDRSSDGMVRLMLKVAAHVHRHVGIFHGANTFPNSSMLTKKDDNALKQHKASKYFFRKQTNYYEDNYSFWIAQSLSKLQNITLKFILPLLTIFAFFIEVLIPAFNLYTRRQLDNWYYTINEIDTAIGNLSLRDTKEKREVLRIMLAEVRATDNVPATHMELFYTLQNQIVNILNDLDKRITKLMSHTPSA